MRRREGREKSHKRMERKRGAKDEWREKEESEKRERKE